MNLDERKFLRDLGDRIRQRRKELGWTQAELGERCELHRTFIGSVERGERNIALLNLRKIAQVLRVPLTALLADTPNEEGAQDGSAGRAPQQTGRSIKVVTSRVRVPLVNPDGWEPSTAA